MSEWRRADQGDLPEPGDTIAIVSWKSNDSTVVVKERVRVEVVYAEPRFRIFGPSLPFETDERVVLPPRPDNPEGGEIIMWKKVN